MESFAGKAPPEKLRRRSFACATSYLLWNSMLRISRIESSSGEVVLRLEGSLIGPWVDELRRSCAAVCNNGRQLSLDLTEVLFADSKRTCAAAHSTEIQRWIGRLLTVSDGAAK